ncbi:CinA family protein [Pseudonocardia sp. CA-107938]|uniref:CinA family protein n=1 Tax=Pseudonocardia sp. CA-107938 TaxID=3240021 RepID=UPI003D91BFAA
MTDAERAAELAAEVSRLARSTGRTVAAAETLTGGALCAALAAAESSSTWFRGGVVACADGVAEAVLDVPDGQVHSAAAARAMGVRARALLSADVAVAVTGADDASVFLTVADGSESGSEPLRSNLGRSTAVVNALELLVERLRLPAVSSTGPIGSG